MKMELINENQLEIFFSHEDFAQFKLSYDDLDYKNEEVRSAFWEIMKIAKEQKGFDAFDSKLTLETQKNENGVLMTVTRNQKKGNYFRIKNGLSVKKHSDTSSTVSYIYVYTFHFEKFEDLILCCNKTKDLSSVLYNTLYYWDENYYLSIAVVSFENNFISSRTSLLHMLNEYGKPVKASRFDMYLKEHSKEVIPFGAIEKIQNSFNFHN
jgi:negative regulator of genetic competence, sporulation and motility